MSGIHSQSSRFSECLGSLLQLCLTEHTQLVIWAPAGSPPLQKQFSLAIPASWHLQNAGVSCCNWAALSPIASPGLCHGASAFLLDSFNLGTVTAPQAASADCTSSVFPQRCASAALCDPPFLQLHHWRPSHSTRFRCQHKVTPRPCLEHDFLTLRKPFLENFPSMILIPS